MDVPIFAYMRWAKEHSAAHRFDLMVSGVAPPDFPAIEAPLQPAPAADGDPGIERRIGERYGVPADHVLFVPGATLGLFLLTRCLMRPGDRVVVETPAYENLPGLVRLFGGEAVPLPRRPEDGYHLDPDRLEAALAAGGSLVLITDLHNPTGVGAEGAELDAIRDVARRHGARIVLDEVYRDFRPGPVATAYRDDDPVLVTTSSFTKVYGFGPARSGWICAPPDLRATAVHLVDYLTVLAPAPVTGIARRLLTDADSFRDRGLRIAERGDTVFREWVRDRDDISFVEPAGGLTRFVAVRGLADTEPMADWLRETHDTAVVPGRFFGDPGRIRVGLGIEPDLLRQALANLGDAIRRFRG